jgi:hypothetical protein
MTRRHGQSHAFKVGEDLFIESSAANNQQRINDVLGVTESTTSAASTNGFFRYGRMFRNPNLDEFRPDSQGLIELGSAMTDNSVKHTFNIPAGYVYFGQFVDHDLSFDKGTHQLGTTVLVPEEQISLRSPSLDLDSLYGFNPAEFRNTDDGKQVYDGDRLRVGTTQAELAGNIIAKFAATAESFRGDLPRRGGPPKKQAAAIVDPRNDENLAIAQTHLAFIKFHNAVVERFSSTGSPTDLFMKAREAVVQHYQWIILKDYLPKIIEPGVLNDVIEKGNQFFQLGENEDPFVPVEFSAAAFRLGHALINSSYEWNPVFSSPPGGFRPASLLIHLFAFTGFGNSDLLAQDNLPSSWIIDWTRFYDFQGFSGISVNHQFNGARSIAPSVIPELMNLEPFPGETDPNLRVLPVRTLLRGRLLGLPSGQNVARRMGLTPLTPAVVSARHPDIMKKYGFDQSTPLWYYILREADEIHSGDRLGPVGSRLVAEIFVALIKKSRISILPKLESGPPVFEPYLGRKTGEFSMPELLFFVHQTFAAENYINPLSTGGGNQ